MRRALSTTASLALIALVVGCGDRGNDGPISVSQIGPMPTIVDPNQKPLSATSAILLAATAQGLVRFDGAGQIEPGLAIRWAVSDDGLYYTFRLADGTGIDADDVARRLRTAIGQASRNPLKPLFGGLDEIVAVTPEVIEIRLVSPQPNLLELLAQPEMALLDGKAGSGPFQIAVRENRVLTLTPVVELDDEDTAGQNRRTIKLRGERAAQAVARFADGKAALVLGGTFQDFPLTRHAKLPPRTLRRDPVAGLFGLAVVDATGFLADPENRRILSMTIDRDRIATAFVDSGWRTAMSLIAPGTTELGAAIPPNWAGLNPQLRQRIAAGVVRQWTAGNSAPPHLRIAMPEGPGARLLFALLASGWRQIGVEIERVPAEKDAELRLIDVTAPSDTAAWYLRSFSCPANPACTSQVSTLLDAAAKTGNAAERTALLGKAETMLADAVPFLPIAQPLRWSLAAPRLEGFRENPRGVHPLNHLLRDK
jgi:peptide/nickel transport system substrate-binding protein